MREHPAAQKRLEVSVLNDTTDLVPVLVPGANRQIMATIINGSPMVSLRHACDTATLDYSGQLQKLKQNHGQPWRSSPRLRQTGKRARW
ncbi:hypothetical protein SEA_NYMPHADORA_48 [Gordonia phage Nymphadora]|uniref:Uncharacterized protein n=1 Tax=Gordonia phage Nymphadora TaxID=1821558 RepID=A0A142KAS4_9CAUD|nr:hypothetical protein SEA_NYMPHADORA_48 [Gordonia phage Nymphadora]AMS03207.1 hypothetical protein SEA_NYMPHADORA_48 [Gordonia phage Nymphadora]